MAVLRPSQPPADAPHDPVASNAMALGLLYAAENEPTVTRSVEIPALHSSSASFDDGFDEPKTAINHRTLENLTKAAKPLPADAFDADEETIARPPKSDDRETDFEAITTRQQLTPPRPSHSPKTRTLNAARASDDEIDSDKNLLPPPLSDESPATKSVHELAAATIPFPAPPLDHTPPPSPAIHTPLAMTTALEDNATRIVAFPTPTGQLIPDPAPMWQPPARVEPMVAAPSREPTPFPIAFLHEATSSPLIVKVVIAVTSTLVLAIAVVLFLRPQVVSNSMSAAEEAPTPVPVMTVDHPPPPPVATLPPPVTTATVAAPPASTVPPPATTPPPRRRVTRSAPRPSIPTRRE